MPINVSNSVDAGGVNILQLQLTVVDVVCPSDIEWFKNSKDYE